MRPSYLAALILLAGCGTSAPTDGTTGPNFIDQTTAGSSTGSTGQPCEDLDGDGRGTGCGSGTDCSPNDPFHWDDCGTCVDQDGDTYGDACNRGDDCEDGNARVWEACESCADADGDSYWTGCDDLAVNTDCDDSSGTLYQNLQGFTDTDGDGYTVETTAIAVCSGTTLPPGYSSTTLGVDCDDGAALYSDDCPASVLANIHEGTDPANFEVSPKSLVSVSSGAFRSTIVYAANSKYNGVELFRLNTTSRTAPQLIRDFVPGTGSSVIGSSVDFGTRALFALNDTVYGLELYVTDGTTAGTKLVKDIHASDTAITLWGGPSGYFGFGDNSLWVTDGTSAGTQEVPGSQQVPSGANLNGVALTSGGLYFASNTEATGTASLYRSYQGSALSLVSFTGFLTSQTATAKRIVKASSSHLLVMIQRSGTFSLWGIGGTSSGGTATRISNTSFLPPVESGEEALHGARFGNVYYFSHCPVVDTGCEVYKAINNASVLVSDVNPGTAGSNPRDFLVCGDYLYFTAGTATVGRELWRTDGSGANLVRNIAAGDANSSPKNMVCNGSKVFFLANDGGGQKLWVTQGTVATTLRLTNFDITSLASPLLPQLSGVYFAPVTAGVPKDLWFSDGTADGTRVVHDGDVSNSSGISSFYRHSNGQVAFSAIDNQSGSNVGAELWASGGTAATTRRVADINVGADASSPKSFASLGSTLLFSATSSSGQELWASDLTTVGTRLVKDIASAGSASPSRPVVLGSRAFFSADNGSTGIEPWVTDGSTVNTTAVADAHAGSANSTPTGFTLFDNNVYFSAEGASTGQELWFTPLASPNTATLLADINTSPGVGSSPSGFVEADGRLYFAATDESVGRELYRINDAGDGILLVKDHFTAASSGNPRTFTVLANKLIYVADDGATPALWVVNAGGTDASKIGTNFATAPRGFVQLGTDLLFLASKGTDGEELWKTDGVTASLVKNIHPTANTGSSIDALYVVDDKVMFFADDNVAGRELWISDATNVGTVRVKNINPDKRHAVPGGKWPIIRVRPGVAVFAAANAENGLELWRSDGTANGTVLHQDLNPGPASSSPRLFTLVPNDVTPTHVVFIADKDGVGAEPWTLDLSGF